MKLGGWWRLWIVLTAIYGAVVVAFFISEWPSPAKVPHGPWLTYRMSAESQRLLQAPSLWDGYVHKADSIKVMGPNGHSFELLAGSSKVEVDAFIEDYTRVLKAEATDLKVKTIMMLPLMLLIPPILLMILALSARWVWRGFQRNRNTP